MLSQATAVDPKPPQDEHMDFSRLTDEQLNQLLELMTSSGSQW
jgi:hypothetical protein